MQDYFSIAAVQPEVYSCQSREEIYEKNLKRHLELIDWVVYRSNSMIAAPCRLIVFPEFGIHGMPQKGDGSWNGVAINIPGEETELLSKKAKALNVYIASHGWTVYPDLPGRPFSVGFLIAPSGEIILKHDFLICYWNL